MAAPVIFFLGGPGSSKTKHAQNLSDIHDGYRHINMVVVIGQHIKENDVASHESVSSSVALALLAKEMNITPRCKGFLVSGYPRFMDDLYHYMEKLGNPSAGILLEMNKDSLLNHIELGKLDGAILTDWQESTLLDSVETEARFNQVVLDAAKRDLMDFHSLVLPVCEYLDNKGMLYVISCERSHEEVFVDVQRAHRKILQALTLPPSAISIGSFREYRTLIPLITPSASRVTQLPFGHHDQMQCPPVLFVMGGPGSNKGVVVKEILYLYPGWAFISIGETMRREVEAWRDPTDTYEGLPSEKMEIVERLMRKGEMVQEEQVMYFLERELEKVRDSEGVIITGFPKDIMQAYIFEEQFNQAPLVILIDCSELELGRNLGRRETRLDDNVAAAHRRLAIYREISLPMLKAFDDKNRILIIDGDADEEQVIRELKRAIYVETQRLSKQINCLDWQLEEVSDGETDIDMQSFTSDYRYCNTKLAREGSCREVRESND